MNRQEYNEILSAKAKRKSAGMRELKSAMVDMHRSLPRPNRIKPTDNVELMNTRSRELARSLGYKRTSD